VNRLTDEKTAQALKEIIDKLEAGGFEVDMSNLRYVRLAEYERFDEEVEGLGYRFTLDASKTIKKLANEALDSYDYKGHTIREWVEIILGKEGDK
jgi:hypothetical protein